MSAAIAGLKSLFPFVVICFGGFMALLDIQIVASSLQQIGGGLSAAQDEIAWVQTAYLIAEIITIPLSGWLTRVFSTRWLFVASAAGFTATSLLCGLAWNIQSMIVFRAAQGLLGASMIPTMFTSSFVFFPGPRRVYAAAVVGTIASIAPTLGPVIGGWITDAVNWHWLFYVNLLPGTAVTLLAASLVRIDEPDLRLLNEADYFGIALMAIGLGTLEYVLEEGSRWNWFDDATIRNCAWIAAIAGIGFVVRSLMVVNPVVDLRALKNRNFAVGCFLSFVTGIGIFATIYLTPLFLARVRGFSAAEIGWAVFSTGCFQVSAIPIYTFFARKIDLRWLMVFGLLCFGMGLWQFSFITHDWGWRELLLPQALRGFAQQFSVAPIVTLALGSLPPERLKLASGLFNLMRNLGGAIGIAGCGTILNDRTNLHFARIAESLSPTNTTARAVLDALTARYTAVFHGDATLAHTAALKQLWNLAMREALTETFADAFLLISLCLFAMVFLAPLMRSVVPPKQPTADAH